MTATRGEGGACAPGAMLKGAPKSVISYNSKGRDSFIKKLDKMKISFFFFVTLGTSVLSEKSVLAGVGEA